MNFFELKDVEKKLLSVIRNNPYEKRVRIAEMSNVPWTTATTSIGNMVAEKDGKKGMLINGSFGNTKGLIVNEEFGYFIGVSIGTSKIKVSVLNFAFQLVDKHIILDALAIDSTYRHDYWVKDLQESTDEYPLDYSGRAVWCAPTKKRSVSEIRTIINAMCDFAVELKDGTKGKSINIISIGFSFSGHVDCKNNVIIEANNLSYNLNNVSLNSLLTSSKIDSLRDSEISICFEHNVKAAAIAERYIGLLSDNTNINISPTDSNCAILYLGAGLGMSMYINGKLIRGHSNNAGQIGKIMNYGMDVNTTLEEDLANLFESMENVRRMNGRELAEILDANSKIKKEFVNYLSTTIFNIANLLELDCVVLTGKLSSIYPSIEELFQTAILEHNHAKMIVMPSKLGEFSASFGSAICGYFKALKCDID